jgi:hypothetical protein
MPAKRTPREPDAQADLIGHAKANTAAHEWATKAIELRAAGKLKDAKAAEKRAMMFLRRVLEIEKRYPAITRERYLAERGNR